MTRPVLFIEASKCFITCLFCQIFKHFCIIYAEIFYFSKIFENLLDANIYLMGVLNPGFMALFLLAIVFFAEAFIFINVEIKKLREDLE